MIPGAVSRTALAVEPGFVIHVDERIFFFIARNKRFFIMRNKRHFPARLVVADLQNIVDGRVVLFSMLSNNLFEGLAVEFKLFGFGLHVPPAFAIRIGIGIPDAGFEEILPAVEFVTAFVFGRIPQILGGIFQGIERKFFFVGRGFAGLRILIGFVVLEQIAKTSFRQFFGNQPGDFGLIDLVFPYRLDNRLHEGHVPVSVPDRFDIPPLFKHVMGVGQQDIGKPGKLGSVGGDVHKKRYLRQRTLPALRLRTGEGKVVHVSNRHLDFIGVRVQNAVGRIVGDHTAARFFLQRGKL